MRTLLKTLTPDRKHTFHGTAMAIYKRSVPEDKKPDLNVDTPDQSRSIRELPESITSLLECPKPPSKPFSPLYPWFGLFAAENELPLSVRDVEQTIIKPVNDIRQKQHLMTSNQSRAELQEIVPGLSKWRIDQARQHGTERGRGQPVEDQPIHRTRIDVVKVDDFIDFISRPDMLQDVAFGTKTLKLDSGERIIIPSVIRTMIPSRIIEQYITYCKEHNFVPAGERSLYRMLQVCSASMQKSLHGLDNIASEGTEAFDNLTDVIKTLTDNGAEGQWGQNAQQYLKESKRYLKTDFKIHVGREENSQDHCTVYSLSDTGNTDYSIPCDHDHTTTCERCNLLETTLQEILTTINSVEMTQDQKARVMFQYTECTQAIHAWKAHLLRSINQEEAKQDALAKLDDETCLIVIDWAMKFLPQHYREQMSEFFGKRGRSWHISAVITKKDDKFEVECFSHPYLQHVRPKQLCGGISPGTSSASH
ncbi:hypothetical protein QZH41_001293 [Actinostola sp. cb2023]|nr:hypothetical protein QZH41_001293 [Actinostola sp. cb2023]